MGRGVLTWEDVLEPVLKLVVRESGHLTGRLGQLLQ